MVNVGREAMMAIGCIQAQRCHTGHCPTGVATQSSWLSRGLNPSDKSVRVMNYNYALQDEILRLCHSVGVTHPALIPESVVEIVNQEGTAVSILNYYGLLSIDQRLQESDFHYLESI